MIPVSSNTASPTGGSSVIPASSSMANTVGSNTASPIGNSSDKDNTVRTVGAGENPPAGAVSRISASAPAWIETDSSAGIISREGVGRAGSRCAGETGFRAASKK